MGYLQGYIGLYIAEKPEYLPAMEMQTEKNMEAGSLDSLQLTVLAPPLKSTLGGLRV